MKNKIILESLRIQNFELQQSQNYLYNQIWMDTIKITTLEGATLGPSQGEGYLPPKWKEKNN